jgi:hypothetical protein
MFLFNRLRALPDWHEADGHLESAQRLAIKKRQAFEESQGRSFNEFARKQVDSVQAPLFKLDGALKQSHEAIKASDDALFKIRSEFTKLRPLNESIVAKRKDAQAVQDRFEKSQKAAARAQERLDSIRAKAPTSPDFARAQDDYDQCLRQKQSDQTAAEERALQLGAEERAYKREFALIVLKVLEEYAYAHASASSTLVLAGQQLQQHGESIRDFDDPTIDILQSQLQQLNSEPIQ